jgi:hypothetical protein
MHSVLVDGGFYEVDGANLAGLHFSVPKAAKPQAKKDQATQRQYYRDGGGGKNMRGKKMKT